MTSKIRLGISTCLLGENVRYDGGHQLDGYLRDTLGQFVEYVPVCPEVECGLPVPREAMRLVGEIEAPRLVTIRTKNDLTDRMVSWARERLKALEKEELCGFIFKKGSPSSGMERIKVYQEQGGPPVKKGVGIYARMFMEHFPLLPVEEDGRLHDPVLRENFIERIFVYKRWREMLEHKRNRGGLVEFHTRHKLLILAHGNQYYREMGTLVAHAKEYPFPDLLNQYETILMKTLALRVTMKKHINVLQHVMGYFKNDLSKDEKQELLEIIANYGNKLIPLIVPVTLLNHYVRKYQQPYLAQQVYLNPHPVELQLRNHV